MKIIMIDYFLPNSIYSLELCEKLSVDNEVLLICKDNYQPNGQKHNVTKILSVLHSSSSNILQAFVLYIKDLKKIDNQIKLFKPDVVHLQGVQHIFWETLLLRKNRRIVGKYFFTAHNILSHESKKGEKASLNKWYKNFDGIIVHNEASKRMLRQVADYAGHVYVIPHGSYDTYREFHNIKKNSQNKTVFLQFGIIRDYKGIDILLEAISKLPQEIKERTHFIIAGALRKKYYDFNINKFVEDYAIEDCVELIIRRIDDEEVPMLFSRADCCLFPYRHIYGSGALLMAYTFNKPVIVSSLPVFEEETNYGKTGIVFEKENSDSLSNAIIEFCEMTIERKAKFSAEIEHLVTSKYNWTLSAKETVKCYHS